MEVELGAGETLYVDGCKQSESEPGECSDCGGEFEEADNLEDRLVTIKLWDRLTIDLRDSTDFDAEELETRFLCRDCACGWAADIRDSRQQLKPVSVHSRTAINRELARCDHSRHSWEGDELICKDCCEDVSPHPGESCVCCDDEGSFGDGEWCNCDAGKRAWAKQVDEHSYMAPLARRANAARRAGDEDEYQRIRKEAIS